MMKGELRIISEFQDFAFNACTVLFQGNGISEVYLRLVLPEHNLAELGVTIEVSIPGKATKVWLHPNSFQFFENETDEFGETLEIYDCLNGLEELKSLFIDRIADKFHISTPPSLS